MGVTVTSDGGTSSSVPFVYIPVVTGLSPASGPGSGGTSVTINGSGFTQGSSVSFGSTPATSVTVNASGTSITATSPGGAGTVGVTVTSDGNKVSAGSYTYLQQVTGVSPNSGPGSGGTVVTISGSGFTQGSSVSFGSTPATSVTVNASGTSITATSPGGTGVVQVTVSNSSGTSATNANTSFSYTPVVTGITPAKGPGNGGTQVTVTGSGFSSDSSVSFGGRSATNVSVNAAGTSLTATSPPGAATVDVTVTTSGGTSAANSSSSFTYTPVVSGISPSSGPATGGTLVTISGAGFTPESTVQFGSTLIASVSVNAAGTAITVAAPGGIGNVGVSVSTTGGTSPAETFSYVPVVTGLNPSSGPASGGTTVTINGVGFTANSTVSFGPTPAESTTVDPSGTSITATSPAGTGTVQVTVTNSAGTSSLSPQNDTFHYSPVVLGVSPSNGSANGGTQVTITGSGFTGATGVFFGNAKASKFTVVSDTKIAAISPSGTGTVAVSVANASGTSSVTSSVTDFTYAPVVTGVSPNTGPAIGATPVTISGTGFTGALYVSFGGVETKSFTVNSTGTSITVTSPTTNLPTTSLPGSVDVTVTTGEGGTSSATSSDQYTYKPTPSAPKIGVALQPDSSGVASGSSIGLTITATNTGGSTANSATLTDTLPSASGVNWTFSNGPSDCAISGGVLNCGPSDLAAGASYTVQVASQTTSNTCGSGETILNDVASLSASNVGSSVQNQAQIDVVCLHSVSGQILDGNGKPVGNASVALCPTNPLLPDQGCATAVTDSQGYYTIGSLPPGSYNGTVITLAGPMQFGPVTVSGGSSALPIIAPTSQIQGYIQPMPSNLVLEAGSLPPQTATTTSDKGALPNIVSTLRTTVSKTNACPDAKGATFTVYATDEDPNSPSYNQLIPVVSDQPLVESPVGSGNYTGSFEPIAQLGKVQDNGYSITNMAYLGGSGKITMNIPCPGSTTPEKVAFTVYIDPSGVVVNQSGVPISGATVTLLTSSSGAPGTYSPVPDGSAVMSPADRTNPQITDSSGLFGWDVIAGYYEIEASLNGCASQPLTFQVPPSLSNVSLTLNCPKQSAPSGPTNDLQPTNVAASPGNASASVSWNAPLTSGGDQITGYEVIPYIGSAPQAPQTFDNPATSETITGLTNGTTYVFRVAAINAAGTGPVSQFSNAVVPSTVPGAPSNVSATAGNSSATLTWNSPSSDGGSPITAYMITPYIGNTPQAPQVFNTPATADTIVGLTNGTSYTFKVAAINAAGTGPDSPSSNKVTPENSLGPVPAGLGGNGTGPSAIVKSSGGSGSNATSSGGILTGGAGSSGGGNLISPTIGSNVLATSLSFNVSNTANDIGNLTNGSLYTFIWFFGWLLICIISGRYFFYRRRDFEDTKHLKVVSK